MAYVLEYSAFFYDRRRRRRNALLALLGVFVLAAAVNSLWWDSVTKAPTFADYVANGVRDPVRKTRGADLKTQAKEAWNLRDAYSALEAEYGKFRPYLRLSWVPVPATNVLSVVAERLSGDRSLALLEPESVCIEFLERTPRSLSGSRSRSLELKTVWRTRREYSVEEGVMTREALSNWLARAYSGSSRPEVASLAFPNGGHPGEEVRATFRFPGSPVLPPCPALDETVRHLDALRKALLTAPLGRNGSQELTLSYLEGLLDLSGKIALENSRKEYNHDLFPGDWLKMLTGNGKINISNNNNDNAKAVFAAWDRAVSGRSPRDRRALRPLFESGDFMTGDALKAFLSSMPSTAVVDSCRTNLLALVSGLTNAISAELFVPFDPAPFGRDVIHATTNLFALPGELDVLPPVRALAGADPSAESFVVRYPTVHNEDGVRLSRPDGGESSARYLFCDWEWSYASTNRPADLVRFSEGLRNFASRGFGYEPGIVKASLRNGRAVEISVKGIVPVSLDTGNASAAPAKKPDSGANPDSER